MESGDTETFDLLLEGVSTVFESLGRALICLDHELKVVHVSQGLDLLLGEGAGSLAIGRQAQEILGEELFGSDGNLRGALLGGERREGWGATLRVGDSSPRRVSITAAPIQHGAQDICDPRVAFVVVVRPIEEDPAQGATAPTVFSGLVARSASMMKIFSLIEHLRESEATVLIGGESGTGKELVARAVHVHSPRRSGPFVAVNCGALPGELLESELFGHVRGAFTGAVKDRVGRFELGAGGTLFLDEVGDIPAHLQVKLLRVLQEKTYERVGESRTRTTDVRVIAATNRDLRQEIRRGRFRDDLYYRLRVVPIEVPPLRQRREDIEPLARHLLAKISGRHGRSLILAPGTIRCLLRYGWPGNVRELENALEYAVAITQGQTIHADSLPVEVVEGTTQLQAVPVPPEAAPEPGQVDDLDPAQEVERQRIVTTLQAHQWRRTEAARALGMSRTTLWRRMRELGLQR